MPTHALVNNGNTDITVAVYQHPTTITDAQIKAWSTTPITILPEPPSGKYFLITNVLLRKTGDWSANGYGNIATDAYLEVLHGVAENSQPVDSVAETIPNISGQAYLTQFFGGGGLYLLKPPQTFNATLNADWASSFSLLGDSQPVSSVIRLKLTNSSGALTGGDPANTLEVTVLYSIIDI